MTKDTIAGMVERVARAICKSKTCEGAACCQWPGNGGKPRRLPHCNAERGAYDDAALAAIEAMREPTVGQEAANGQPIASPKPSGERVMEKGEKMPDASNDIDAHIGWLKMYLANMNERNWRDMKLYAERQIDRLEEDIDRVAPNADAPCKHCKGSGLVADYVGLDMRCVPAECLACKPAS